jgi:hypothetical protein
MLILLLGHARGSFELMTVMDMCSGKLVVPPSSLKTLARLGKLQSSECFFSYILPLSTHGLIITTLIFSVLTPHPTSSHTRSYTEFTVRRLLLEQHPSFSLGKVSYLTMRIRALTWSFLAFGIAYGLAQLIIVVASWSTPYRLSRRWLAEFQPWLVLAPTKSPKA